MRRCLHVMVVAAICMVAAGSVANCQQPKKQTDSEIAKLLVGKWTIEEGKDKEPKVRATFVYKKDGTFAVDTTIEADGKVERIQVTGTWKIADGVILDTVKTSNTERFKEGRVTKDTVLSIDDATLKYTTEKGRERVWKRAKE